MKNFLSHPDHVVESALRGLLAQSSVKLERVADHPAVVFRGNTKRKVRIVTGGGSGHEPLFLGAVGPGMADGGVAGQVFAAPNPFSIQAAGDACAAEDGVIFIYGNYSGDVLNFQHAVEEMEAEGKRVAEISVHDDIASRPVSSMSDRRGTAGDLFVIKCTAAAADRGASLEEVLRLGKKVNHRTRSLGVAVRAASSIVTGKPMFELPPGHLEIGMGLHGEVGVRRAEAEPLETLVPEMLEMLLADFRATGLEPDRVAVMVNGLGGTTVIELLAVSGLVDEALIKAGIETGLFITGEFATSLDMAGFSITLLHFDEEIEPLLNAPCESFCFSQRNPLPA